MKSSMAVLITLVALTLAFLLQEDLEVEQLLQLLCLVRV